MKGDVWLTETGGIVKFGRNFPRDEQRAARSITFALKLARDNERVKRVYLYNWTGAQPDARFDSGLIGSDGDRAPGLRRAEGRARELTAGGRRPASPRAAVCPWGWVSCVRSGCSPRS